MSDAATAAAAAQVVVDKFDQYLQQVSQTIQHYGPDAVQLGLGALQVDAASNLVSPIIAIIMTPILGWVSAKLWCWGSAIQNYSYIEDTAKREQYAKLYRNNVESAGFVGGGMLGIFAVIIGIYGIFNILDVWSWVGIFKPELYAVHKFLIK